MVDYFAAVGQANYYITLLVEREPLGAFEAKPDRIGIGTRCNHEIIFELALICAVKDQIDSRIDAAVPDF